MAGTIVADTLTHSTAGSLTTDYVVNGSAKAWVNFNGTGTIATRDSHNVSSLTDNATGDHTINVSSSLGNINYAVTCGGGYAYGNSGAQDTTVQCYDMTTSAFDLAVGYNLSGTTTKRDHALNVAHALGDLA
jgi:hypothetical protein